MARPDLNSDSTAAVCIFVKEVVIQHCRFRLQSHQQEEQNVCTKVKWEGRATNVNRSLP
jgi:hypothetical protein